MDSYDVVVIGAGPAGENAAQYAIQSSDRTAVLVEHELVGGECSYYACMPSKALLRPLEVGSSAANLPGLTGPPDIDVPALLRRRDSWVSEYDDGGQVDWAHGAGIDVVRGRGRLAGERRVEIETASGPRTVAAREAVVLATGSEPVVPEAFAGVQAWSSRDVTSVVEVPGSLAIVGGGVVACESATWMARLGTRVTMLVRGDALLGRFEPFAGELVADVLRDTGVDVRVGTDVTGATRPDARPTGLGRVHGGPVELSAGEEAWTVDEVLLATGRRPRTDALGLETVGLDPGDLADGVRELRPWLYAVGDVTGGPALTHWGKYQARLVGDRIAARAESQDAPVAPDAPVPQVVFSAPQVASVGTTLQEARRAGRDVEAVDVDLGSVAGTALLRDDAAGTARLVIDVARESVVGATFCGPEVAELLHAATIAVIAQVPLETLWHAVPAFPTSSEVWLRLLEAWRSRR